jgi:NAD(P)-dependent dehydrogenase (short-subunit alcohol dehydrogenase family)
VRVAGKVALITGGATGIGRASAEALAREGATGVVVNYSRSAAEAEEAVAALRDLGTDAMAIKADVADSAQVRDMVAQVVEKYGKLDILVNNAATTRFASWDDVDEELWNRVMAVNLNGPFYTIKTVAPIMRANGNGRIVNVSSMGGMAPVGSSAAYSVSKAGLNHLTRVAAKALGPEIRVNAVLPGLVLTRWNADRPWEAAQAQIDAAPLKIPGHPEDIANAVLYFASDESRFVTGQCLVIDGGRYMH